MSNEVKISIIVPIFNSEAFLLDLLDSIASQTFRSFEVIFVDDGSTDSSLQILKRYSQKFSNWKIFKISHQGVGAARNFGLKHACGEFISFVDSDDKIDPDFLNTLYYSAINSGADIAVCNYKIFYLGPNLSFINWVRLNTGVYASDVIIKHLITDVRVHFWFFNKIFKRELFISNKIEIPNMCFEDMIAVLQLFYFAKKVSVSSRVLYRYNKHNKSLLSKMNEKKMEDYLKAFTFLKSFLISKGVFHKYRVRHLILGFRVVFIALRVLIFDDFKFRGLFRKLKNVYKKIFS
ncbi:MAG: glycosyltransferase [Oscillospiraceae bacterium]|jgi:glycosyltransferase involved in cell wall biosynthesis|nr:glycosyltransferase [Oscillospiraceae bacterium]